MIERVRIPVERLTCEGCDCGACVTDVVQNLMKLNGVIYVGVDRLNPAFSVRYDNDTVTTDVFRSVVTKAKLTSPDQPADPT